MNGFKIRVPLISLLLASCCATRVLSSEPRVSAPAQTSAATQPHNEDVSDAEAEQLGLGAYVSFPESGIRIRQPKGFEKADSFDGFGHAESKSSVMVMAIPGPYAKVTKGFTPEQMKARGWTFHSLEETTVDDQKGILVHFEQPVASLVFVKWVLAFGSEQKTTMVMATFPKTQERELSVRLKAAVLGARSEQTALAAGEGLPFTLTPSKKLKVTPGINKMLAYTQGGALPAKSAEEAIFVAAPSLGNFVVDDRRQFAVQRLRESAHTKSVDVKSTKPIEIAGLNGYELTADAKDSKSGTPLMLYQVILFDENSYILMHGRVGAELRDEYLPEFRTMAQSLRKKAAK